MSDEQTMTVKCLKTGREYEAPVSGEDGTLTVHLECPYCANRGLPAIMDDIQQRVERVKSRL